MMLGFRCCSSPSWRLARTGLMAALLAWGSTSAMAGTHDAPLRQQGPAPDTSGWSGKGDALPAFATEIAEFYRMRSYRTVWLDRGALNGDGRLLIEELLRSHEHGLSFGDLAVPRRRAAGPALSDAEALAYDQQLTALFLQYCRALRTGRLTPESAGVIWAIPRPSFDAAEILLSLGNKPLPVLLDEQPPPHAEYRKLQSALAFYRAILARGGWPTVHQGPVLESGRLDPRVGDLRRRLAIEGYETVFRGGEDELFDSGLVEAVKAFQQSHGLARDGRVGRQTLAALNTPTEERIEQIQLNMERWRWMPRSLPDRRIEVNAPAAWLDLVEDGRVTLAMKTIVGSAVHPTPALQATVRAVIVNPVWNVPDWIVRKEIVPRLRRDPGFLEAQDIRILDRPQDPYGRQIAWSRVSGSTGLRLQQQPGPLNALGRLKFDMPNGFDVYLHDTPARTLFERDDRALSHGCVRLQLPGRLAGRLLDDPDESFSARFGETVPTRLALEEPIPVYLVYWTAFVGDSGEAQFRRDIYGVDARMRERLRGTTDAIRMSSRTAGGCPSSGALAG